MAWRGVIEEYRDRLPVDARHARRHAARGRHAAAARAAPVRAARGCEVYLKVEGANPTGSFKDRGMTIAVSKAAEAGAQAVICASTGNTSASAAAYAARGRPDLRGPGPGRQDRPGQAGPGAGARREAAAGRGQLRRLPAAGPRARRELPGRAGQLGQPGPPARAEDRRLRGRRRARRRPRHPLLPVGNAGNISAYWMGYQRVRRRRARPRRTPRMYGFQAAGAAPIVNGAPVDQPDTIATAIRIGNPASWTWPSRRATTPTARSTPSPTRRSWPRTGCCPPARACSSSRPRAASVAGLLKLARPGRLRAGPADRRHGDRPRPEGP